MEKQFTFRTFRTVDLGEVPYKDTWDLQAELLKLRSKSLIPDTLLLLEHPNTYTFGKTADRNNLVGNSDFLQKNGISVFEIDRGGDVTYHGPGQLVGYPIIHLTEWYQDTHKYLRALEEAIILTIAEYGITGTRNSKYTGVWIENRKIAAIGIKVSRWVTMHGFALNVSTNLNLFNGIIPCGISDKEVTSIEKEIGKSVDMQEVKQKFAQHFSEVFSYENRSESTHNQLIHEINALIEQE